MFYCEPCRKERDWPESFSLSRGQCECCGETAVCYDRPSKFLSVPDWSKVVRGNVVTPREAET